MGTRSDIIVHRADGKWSRVYCHWDGYPDHHGPILLGHYNFQKMAEALVAPGDMSSLGEKCTKPKGHSFDHPKKGYCVYYGRDRGEEGTEASVGVTPLEAWGDLKDTGTEYSYIWNDGKWWITSPEAGFEAAIPLDYDVIEGRKKVQANIKAFGGNFVIGHNTSEQEKNHDIRYDF